LDQVGFDARRGPRLCHPYRTRCRSVETVAILRPDLDPVAETLIIEAMEMEDTDGVTVLPGVHRLLAALPKDSWTV